MLGGVRRMVRDEMIYEVGTRPGLIGILRTGYLRRERMTQDGRRAVLGFISPGGVVGEMPGWPARYTLEAATAAEICLISAPFARRLAAEDAEFRRGISADLERQYDHELTFAWLRVALRCRERVIAFLVMAVDLLPSEPQPDGAVIVKIPMGRRDWADLCNTTVESISRQLADLSSEHLVENLGGRRYRLGSLQALRNMTGLEHMRIPAACPVPVTAVNARPPAAKPSVSVRAPVLHAVARSRSPVLHVVARSQ